MPAYDATRFDPPAPLATVTVCSPTTGVSVDNVAMLIDTGADVTILPRAPIEDLVETAELVERYQLEGFDGTRSLAPAVRLELQFLGKVFRGQFLIVDGSHGILGRNVINSVSLIMDGLGADQDADQHRRRPNRSRLPVDSAHSPTAYHQIRQHPSSVQLLGRGDLPGDRKRTVRTRGRHPGDDRQHDTDQGRTAVSMACRRPRNSVSRGTERG